MRLQRFLVYTLVVVGGFFGGFLIGLGLPKEPKVVTMSAPISTGKPDIFEEPSAPPRPIATPAPTPQNEKYLLMLSGEAICTYALLEDGKTELVYKIEVDTAQLRQEDYSSLCRGIQVGSLEEARSLCEDFGG